MKLTIIAFLIAGALLFACKSKSQPGTSGDASSPATTQTQGQMTKAPAGADTVTTPSGLKYIELKVGEGATPEQGQTLSVHYTGWLTNGRLVDSSKGSGQPFTFVLGQGRVIKGWEEGLATMKVGGSRKLIIPPALAWGERGSGDKVPPGATVIFDVDLLEIK